MSSSRPKAWMSELLFFQIRSFLSAQGRQERQAQLRCTAWGARDPDPGSGWGGRRLAARPGAQGLSGFREARPGAALPASPRFLPPPVTPRPLPKYVPFPLPRPAPCARRHPRAAGLVLGRRPASVSRAGPAGSAPPGCPSGKVGGVPPPPALPGRGGRPAPPGAGGRPGGRGARIRTAPLLPHRPSDPTSPPPGTRRPSPRAGAGAQSRRAEPAAEAARRARSR